VFNPDLEKLIGPVQFDPDAIRARYAAERDSRIRDDHNEQYIEVTAEFSRYVDDPYVTPGFTRDPLTDECDITIVGAGFGGLLLGARMRQLGLKRIRLIERGGDVGGTWYWNRYPGAMCDVESYIYLPLLEELGYIPKHRYSFAPEIFEHSKAIARHFDLYDLACFQTGVTSMAWDESSQRWTISTDRGDQMRSRFVAIACGGLSRPKLPGVAGINEFEGYTFHTSRWDYSYTGGDERGNLTGLQNKNVGVIGTGATALQCVPEIGKWAKHLYVFQRTPSSVDVRDNRETDLDFASTLQPGWQQRRMDNFNILVSGGDQDEDLVGDGWTDIYRKLTAPGVKERVKDLGRSLVSDERAVVMELLDMEKMEKVRARVDETVSDVATAESLKPWFRQLCKRPGFHDEYLNTFNRPNVTLVDTLGSGVERLTKHSAFVQGKEYRLDCLIYATGFETGTPYTKRAGFDLVGRDGASLASKWANGLRTLHGLQSHGFPNCFFVGITQTAFTVNIPHTLNEQAKHVAYIIGEAQRRGAAVVEATVEGEEGWVAEMQSKAHLGAKFYAECTPGYYNNEGKGPSPHGYFAAGYGGGPLRFFDIIDEWRKTGRLDGVDLR
jgi:cation diffusion facilitator CzcD-associated flavoprotein CzcO